jgi:O-antigen/teichoic acid export membrane protein
MGPAFDESWIVMCLLVAGSLVQSQNVVAHVMLPGMGELRVFTGFMAVYPVVTAACAVAGILQGGLIGLAAGMSVSMLIMETIFLMTIVRSRFALPLGRVFTRCHLPALKALAPVVLWVGAAQARAPIDSWPVLAGVAIVAGIVFVAGVWTGALTPGERRALRERVAARLRTPAPRLEVA